MSKKIRNVARIALASFVVLAFAGLSYPLLASTLPGAYFGSKITVGDTANTYAIADTNYLQGGHMQVATTAARNAITAERRSLGMLVTVIDTDGVASGNQTATYRLISNRGGGAGCPTTVTDSSFDGLASACATTVDANWAVVMPVIGTGNIGQFLTTTDGANFTWAAVGTGSGGSFTLLTGTSGTDFNIGTSGSVYTFNLPTASATSRGALSAADWSTFNGKQNALGFVPLNPNNNFSEFSDTTTYPSVNLVTARTNLGLGTAATHDISYFLQTANNLSEISLAGSAAQLAARTNLGLGTLATLNSVNNSNWSGTALATTNGGTGLTSYTVGDILYASGTNTLSTLSIGSNGQILTVASGVPVWAQNLGGLFDGSRAITRATVATAAVGGTTLSDFINNFFFPAVSPTATIALSSGSLNRELGASTAVSLTNTATKKTNAVTSVVLSVTGSGATITSAGGTDVPSSGTTTSLNMSGSITTTSGGIGNSGTTSGTAQSSGFGRTASTGTNTNATFTLTVSDGSNTGTSTLSVAYLPKVYAFATSYDYVSNPLGKSDATIVSEFLAASNATSCGSVPCYKLQNASSGTYAPTLSGQYFYYAVPQSVAVPYTSTTAGFTVNGTHNTAWAQKGITTWTNGSGYAQAYYIYGYPSTSGTVMDGVLTGSFTFVSP